jgi:hypothetical protein
MKIWKNIFKALYPCFEVDLCSDLKRFGNDIFWNNNNNKFHMILFLKINDFLKKYFKNK